MKLSIRTKIVLITVGILCCALVANTLTSNTVFTNEYTRALQLEISVMGEGLRYQLERLLALRIPIDELIGFEKQCQDLVSLYKDISYVMVVSLKGTILFHNDPSYHGARVTDPVVLRAITSEHAHVIRIAEHGQRYYESIIPVFDYHSEHVAAIRVGVPLALITAKTRQLFRVAFGVTTVSLIIASLLLLSGLSRWVTKPLAQLMSVVQSIREEGHLSLIQVERPKSADEIGQLSQAFHHMLIELGQSREQVQQYMRQLEVANQQLQADIAARQYAENELRKTHDDLEDRVRDRTAKLSTAVAEAKRLNEHLRQEIIERQRVEDALEQAKEAALNAQRVAEVAQQSAESANRAKSDFLAHMTHELRTPLNGILGYAQILKRDQNLPETHREAIEIMEQSGQHLLRMISDILNLSKIEAGKLELLLREFSLPELIDSVGKIARIQAHRKGIDLVYETEAGLPVYLYGDQTRLRQICLNLLSNAIKFTEEGVVTLRVQLRATLPCDAMTSLPLSEQAAFPIFQRQHCLRFEVRDTGIGIPADQVSLLFKPFQQVKDAWIQSSGAGLGLAISQRLLALMGSELHVSSVLSEGSTFWFDLQLPEVAPLPTLKEQKRTILGFRGPIYRILLVDDIPDNRRLLRNIFLPLGFEIIEASDGADALNKTAEYSPDLILLDILLPDINGIDVARQIRTCEMAEQSPKSGAPHRIPIIAISANVFESTRQKSLSAGCDAFLGKPVDVAKLLDHVHQFLQCDWIYESESHTQPEHLMLQKPGAIPPMEALVPIWELLLKGDIRSILGQVDRLSDLDEKYAAFAEKIRQFAKAYNLDDLEILLRKAMGA